MTDLELLLNDFRDRAKTEREKGTYFETLTQEYFRAEPFYKDEFKEVLTYAEWAERQQLPKKDTGIDLVGITYEDENHAIQCKLYEENHVIRKPDIDSFFTASGKSYFSHRYIICTTTLSQNVKDSLEDQTPPVTVIDINALEDSLIDWGKYRANYEIALKTKKIPRPHQEQAIDAVKKGLNEADRGKLIMACGTGKTFTSLKIAEEMAGAGGKVLFLVPSLALLSQTLTEWTQESSIPLHSFAVCSDSDVGKKKSDIEEDKIGLLIHELQYPATTNSASLAREMEVRHDKEHMSVVFSTYHSIDVISHAQKNHNLSDFDIIICDEAHRTTGATYEGEEESSFVKVHDADFIKSSKRLYMTATPRIFADVAKANAEKDSVTLCSMDNESLFGKELHVVTFSEAVKLGLLVDYKVIILSVEETHINRRLQKLLSDENNQLKVDDAAKIVGCWKAMAKIGVSEDLVDDKDPMKRAVAFCQVIDPNPRARTHKVSSTNIASMFKDVVDTYQEQEGIEEEAKLNCEAHHVDGSMGASKKEEELSWLKAESPENTCRILSNVRCLSEGVDVPALDAVLFLTPRNSQVDVVQSVGRVMRKAGPEKKRGYVILPVVIPAGVEPHEALNDNRTYKVVWQVLQALRSHDDRFDAMVNKMDLELNQSMLSKMEVISVSDKIPAKKRNSSQKKKDRKRQSGRGTSSIGTSQTGREDVQHELQFEIGEIERAIYAKVVQKCGNRHHWEDWANDIAKIARTHIDRIHAILDDENNQSEILAFNSFAEELRDDLNDSISDDEIVEMLAQHMITKPVFDALFEDYSFASNNPISQAMQGVLDALHEHSLNKEADTLEKFYESVKERASGIENATGKQKIIVELYDKFFRNAFPKMTERLGIVYTPVEVVDFIINSINYILHEEFNLTLGSNNTHIIDPFTGTGTFITRLLQSGLIDLNELPNKYKNEIHANEIVLLAYYIAAINIEAVYHSIIGHDYTSFEGICLTDTFQLYEKEDIISDLLEDNSERRKRQKSLDVKIIMGNPPYSMGQKSENDNNKNLKYPSLDSRIENTYVSKSKATRLSSMYDSYIRAIRWASDRINESGIIGFVSNAGWLNSNSADGLRLCLENEFSKIYVFNLRGNIRNNIVSKGAAKEGENIFGSGSMASIAIYFLVKNTKISDKADIYYYDIGDDLSKEDKLKIIRKFQSISYFKKENLWTKIKPNTSGDWINQRDLNLNKYVIMGDKKNSDCIFEIYSNGLVTSRDAWCFNSSQNYLISNIERLINFYNSELDRFNEEYTDISSYSSKEKDTLVENFIKIDPENMNWSRALKKGLARGLRLSFNQGSLFKGLYRPFNYQHLYFDKNLNEMVYQLPKLFPKAKIFNLAIMIKQRWSGHGQFALMTNVVPEFQTDGGTQCFPLYYYKETKTSDEGFLFDSVQEDNIRQDGIKDSALSHFRDFYSNHEISKEDIFYYIYGILHSEKYHTKFAGNLSKELPRIPRVKNLSVFKEFMNSGKRLSYLHTEFEQVDKFPLTIDIKDTGDQDESLYSIQKMKIVDRDDNKFSIRYNDRITIRDVPIEALNYVINGKSSLDWVIDRQVIKTDKSSKIENNANNWAKDTMQNPAYPLELLQRIITVSIETMKIVKSLPELDIE